MDFVYPGFTLELANGHMVNGHHALDAELSLNIVQKPAKRVTTAQEKLFKRKKLAQPPTNVKVSSFIQIFASMVLQDKEFNH